jgi:hypothetical protein
MADDFTTVEHDPEEPTQKEAEEAKSNKPIVKLAV